LTLGFSSHRPETLPLAERLMTRHDVIVVEEPKSLEFDHMLTGKMPIQDYLLTADFEYPLFAAASCGMLQRMQTAGKRIFACEPFMEGLIRIHDRLSSGERPEALTTDKSLWAIYLAEREATGRLLAFYQDAANRDFDAMVQSACFFAAADAERFVLRDRLRAKAIARLLADRKGSIYIEGGYLHLRLLRELRRRLPSAAAIRPLYLLQAVFKAAGEKAHLFNPGDLLTLALIFGRPPARERQHLLAARSLVYNQLVSMDEKPITEGGFPDAREDIEVIRAVNRMSLDTCRRRYAQFQEIKSPEERRKQINLNQKPSYQ